MDTKNWIAVGAASALSLGVIAGGAASVANAMPLIENATGLSVPGIGAVTDGGSGADLDFRVSSDSIVSPASTASPVTPSPASAETAASPVSVASVASPISPVSPLSPVSPISVASPISPVSSISPASVDSPASPASVDSED